MIMRTLALKLAVAAGLVCVASAAQAQTTFNITGTITAGTCTIAVNTGNPLNVGTFNANLFTGTYQSGFVTPVNISYSNCAAGMQSITFKFTGTADKTTGGNANYWDSGLPGAPFELRDTSATGTVLIPSGANTIVINNPGTSGTRPITAQFHQTGALTKTGAGSATVTLGVTYQ
jgi:type 1 fimbria pilin